MPSASVEGPAEDFPRLNAKDQERFAVDNQVRHTVLISDGGKGIGAENGYEDGSVREEKKQESFPGPLRMAFQVGRGDRPRSYR